MANNSTFCLEFLASRSSEPDLLPKAGKGLPADTSAVGKCMNDNRALSTNHSPTTRNDESTSISRFTTKTPFTKSHRAWRPHKILRWFRKNWQDYLTRVVNSCCKRNLKESLKRLPELPNDVRKYSQSTLSAERKPKQFDFNTSHRCADQGVPDSYMPTSSTDSGNATE